MTFGRIAIDAPPLTPRALSLVTAGIDALHPNDPTNGDWVKGFTYAPENSAQPGEVRDVCDTSTVDPNSWTNAPVVSYDPFLILAADKCSSFGFTARDYVGRALRLLDYVTPNQLELEFWKGTLAQAKGYPNRYLADANVVDVTPVTGTAVSRIRGTELLEQAMANCGAGQQAYIHMQPENAGQLGQFTRRVGNLMLSPIDSIIVPGVGYPGTGPGGVTATAGTTWMFATGPVRIRLGDPMIFPDGREDSVMNIGRDEKGNYSIPVDAESILGSAIDRSKNTITIRAERLAAASFDGTCQFAVLVNFDS